jgi:hypothetical protein
MAPLPGRSKQVPRLGAAAGSDQRDSDEGAGAREGEGGTSDGAMSIGIVTSVTSLREKSRGGIARRRGAVEIGMRPKAWRPRGPRAIRGVIPARRSLVKAIRPRHTRIDGRRRPWSFRRATAAI